jgi:hypothetical protein
MACPKWKGLEKCEWFPWRESCVREEVVRGDWKEFNMTVEELTYSYWSCLRAFALVTSSLEQHSSSSYLHGKAPSPSSGLLLKYHLLGDHLAV